LPFEGRYYVCSVSTCNRKRMGLTFCSLPCFEAHVPMARHREAWAEELHAPTRAQWEDDQADAEVDEQAAVPRAPRAVEQPVRRIVGVAAAPGPTATALSDRDLPHDVLIVVSKLKAYVRARSGMNTSDSAVEVLSDIVRELCDGAIRKAAADGRKTVLDRDF
jgi:hypothetical protein